MEEEELAKSIGVSDAKLIYYAWFSSFWDLEPAVFIALQRKVLRCGETL